MDNICKFAMSNKSAENINIINFVYEKDAEFKQSFSFCACYGLYFVMQGEGILHTAVNEYKIAEGDLFFTFSSKPYYIQNLGGLQYIYISFIGLRIPALFDRLKISYAQPVYNDFAFLNKRWEDDFKNANEYNIDLICEGLLLHCLSYLCRQNEEKANDAVSDGILDVKTYVDMHFAEKDLNLKSVSKKFNYSYKYVSNAFAGLTRISFSQYLSNLRLNHARKLLENGMKNIQEVAYSSGFSDAQYFSKAFKKKFGQTPTQYRKNCG